MRISEEEARALEGRMRRIGLFRCTACESYFLLSASRSGLFACPCCGAGEEKVLSVKIGPHDDNDLDDDFE
ncbi:hypothetical protein [Yanshouia hominis]|uniref:Uncharacterized protein n=1 Tax=Yanshouia hominis TaxID=2763673 RepID=A0ABR7NIH4_9FIRM|nr:hypothetical protein [Yanshouia hominis]MBC8576165.1 hypothetical protein [Yanshouia hominis]